MSNILITFPDPILAALEVVRAAMPAVQFGTLDPEDIPNFAPPYVKVTMDGSFDTRRVLETATLRLAVWHNNDHDGLALARTIHAVLLAYPGGTEIRSFAPRTGAFPTKDPDNGLPLSSFTVAARLRPTTL